MKDCQYVRKGEVNTWKYRRSTGGFYIKTQILSSCSFLFVNQTKQSVRRTLVHASENLIFLKCRAPVADSQVSHPKIEVRLSQVWLNAGGLLAGFDGLLISSNLVINPAQIVISFGQIFFDSNRLPTDLHGFIISSDHAIGHTQIIIGIKVVGFDTDCLEVGANGIGIATELP